MLVDPHLRTQHRITKQILKVNGEAVFSPALTVANEDRTENDDAGVNKYDIGEDSSDVQMSPPTVGAVAPSPELIRSPFAGEESHHEHRCIRSCCLWEQELGSITGVGDVCNYDWSENNLGLRNERSWWEYL